VLGWVQGFELAQGRAAALGCLEAGQSVVWWQVCLLAMAQACLACLVCLVCFACPSVQAQRLQWAMVQWAMVQWAMVQ
jgi:hypothetical protein